MDRFVIHTPTTAPEKARPILKRIDDDLGYLPNLYAGLADAPTALEGYLSLDERFQATSLTPLQRTIVLLTASRTNECHYCIAVHTAELSEAGYPDDQIENLRNMRSLSDPKLDALRVFTHRLVEARGQVSEDDVEAFLEAGYERPQVLEIVLGVSMKTLSNYVNHLLDTPLDEQFEDFAWTRDEATVATA